jgi:hypothetical protein
MKRSRQEMLEETARNWLAERDPKRSPQAKQRTERFEGRKQAREQRRAQERAVLARPLLRGV